MNRCSFCEWIPILPWPIWPLAGQLLLGQNVVVGSMTLLLAVRGKHCHEKYVGTPVFFTTALHHGLVWSYLAICGRRSTSIFPAPICNWRSRKPMLSDGQTAIWTSSTTITAMSVSSRLSFSLHCHLNLMKRTPPCWKLLRCFVRSIPPND